MSRIEDLYQQGNNEKTPPALDNIILQAAKQSCEKTTPASKRKAWLYALPTAAVVIFSLSVIINLQHVNEARLEQPSIESISFSPAKLEKTQSEHNSNHEQVKASKKSPRTVKQKPKIDYFDTVSSPAPSAIMEAEEMPQEPQKKARAKENKNISTQSTFMYEEKVIGAGAEDVMVQDKYMAQESDKEKMVTTELRAQVKRQKVAPLQAQINKLNTLITDKNIKQAQVLLNLLKKQYPKHNFKKFEALILQMRLN